MDPLYVKTTPGSLQKQSESAERSLLLHRGLSRLFHEGVCTDFEIVAGNKTFRCHKVVLAAVSDYFCAMFTSEMKENTENKVTFKDISPKVFDAIFMLVYPEKDDSDPIEQYLLSEEEMMELLRVADMLQMKLLLDKCWSHFTHTMNSTNCIERWKVAKSILNTEISQYAFCYLLNHFEEVVSQGMLMSLDFEDFYEVIKDVNLDVGNEDIVWKTATNWIKFDETNRKDYLVDLMQATCLTELGEEILIEELPFDPLIRHCDEATDLVRQAIQFTRHPSLQNSMEIKLRNNMEKEQMLVLVAKRKQGKGSTKKSSSASIQTIFKSLRHQKLITVRPLYDAKEGLAICGHGSSLFVTSGMKLFEYIAKEDRWEEREQCLVPIRGHTVSATDDSLYVFGGMAGFSPNNMVLKYTIGDNKWSIEGEMMASVTDASSVRIKHKIYIFGGKMGDDQFVDSVQEYDTKTQTSTVLCHLPNPCIFSRALNRGDDVYIVTSNGEFIHFSAVTHKIETIANCREFKRIDFGIGMKKDELYVIGGRILSVDGEETEEFASKILCVDVNTGEVQNSKSLPVPLQVFGCATVTTSTKSINDTEL